MGWLSIRSPGMEPGDLQHKPAPSVLVFNPFAEAFIALGKAFTPVKHQALLAADLANLPQFLCGPGDIVLVPERPSNAFLETLREAGFPPPQFAELKSGRIDIEAQIFQQKLGALRPWAWAPDSVDLLEPLFDRAEGGPGRFNERIRQLYSKAWSANFLRMCLAGTAHRQAWLCPEDEAGVIVDTAKAALEAADSIRSRGHHRVVVKEAHGLAGNNALRLWEPEIPPQQRQWIARACVNGRELVVERWQERELDFSAQLEMGPDGLSLCGYTGLQTDLRGQFQANWVEPGRDEQLLSKVAGLLGSSPEIAGQVAKFYSELFAMLEVELRHAGFTGPVSIDAFVYRTADGARRLKPVVEINPRQTMGRLTFELAKHADQKSCGVFRLLGRAQIRESGFTDFPSFVRHLREHLPLRFEGEPRRIRQGALALNDPSRAQACLATFEVGSSPLP